MNWFESVASNVLDDGWQWEDLEKGKWSLPVLNCSRTIWFGAVSGLFAKVLPSSYERLDAGCKWLQSIPDSMKLGSTRSCEYVARLN